MALLHERTEGWAAGLRLAAISLAGHPDPERFVAEFSGSERTVAGYLLAEVLERQPPEVRDLLLRTSVLERVSGPLADALTGGTGSEEMLQSLEDANAFVTSLDVGRSWFRYHHLFADLLQLELRRTSPATVGSLHRAAAQWFEEHGYVVEAIRHAQAARDWAHAARLLADNYVDLVFDGRKATLRALLAAFPAGAPEADAELALAFATARLYDGLLDESGAHIAVAERLAETVPDERRRLFDLRLASARLWLACQRGDLATARQAMRSFEAAFEAQTAGELARTDDHRASALMNFGIAELWSLHMDDARRDLEEALALARRIGRPYLEIGCLGHLALAAVLSGSPIPAGLQLSKEAVTIAEEHGWGTHRIVTPAVAARAGALAWLGRFDEAERWLDRVERPQAPAEELRDRAGAPLLPRVREARARSARGGADGVPRRREPATVRRGTRAPSGRAGVDRHDACSDGRHAGSARGARRPWRQRARAARDAHRRGVARAGGRSPAGCRGRAGAGDRRRAGVGGRRLSAGSQPAPGDGPRATARRSGPGPARRLARRRGIDRARARARRAGRNDPAVHARAGARAARAPSPAPHRPRHAAVDDPRRARRILATARAARRPRCGRSSARPSCAS